MTVCYWCGSKDTLADVGKELDDGKYKMVQCSKCKNAYYVVNKEKINKQKPQTNEEWLRQANKEEMEHTLTMLIMKDRYFADKEFAYVNIRFGVHCWLKEKHNG